MNKLGEGRTAEVYELEPGKIVKLYRSGYPAESIRYEYEVNRTIAGCGVAAPKAYELVDVQERQGITFERIEGTTLLRLMVQQPDALHRLTEKFAALHHRIHSCDVQGDHPAVLKQKEVIARHIRGVAHLPDNEKETILKALERLPEGRCLCHGDYHPDNVMIGELDWTIDWMNGTIGNRAGDVARTLLLLRFGTLPDDAPDSVKERLQRIRGPMGDLYLEHYAACSGLPYSDIDGWMLPVTAARLAEGVPEQEKALLLDFIRERLQE
ncbi:phosphotransferase family protein [Paenibacillus ginsengarvi]|nr:aminoglycoside phosphotransferase family protein [Paenibacillus ginsengarvi]